MASTGNAVDFGDLHAKQWKVLVLQCVTEQEVLFAGDMSLVVILMQLLII